MPAGIVMPGSTVADANSVRTSGGMLPPMKQRYTGNGKTPANAEKKFFRAPNPGNLPAFHEKRFARHTLILAILLTSGVDTPY